MEAAKIDQQTAAFLSPVVKAAAQTLRD